MSGRRSPAKVALGRRIKAARQLAGITSAKKLSTKIADGGFSKDAIDDWETGNYLLPIPRNKIEAIAHACDLPSEFFTMDFRGVVETLRRLDESDLGPGGALLHDLLGELPILEGRDETDGRQGREPGRGGDA